jgi:hypothetical protein
MPVKKKRKNTITVSKTKVKSMITRLEKKVSQVAIINEARKLQRSRGLSGKRDAAIQGKRVLSPTLHNLKLWAGNPRRYELKGVDTKRRK